MYRTKYSKLEKTKLTKDMVFRVLVGEGQITIGDLAKKFNVNKATIRRRLRELRKDDDKAIIHNQNGIMNINKDIIKNDKEAAKVFSKWLKWLLNVWTGLMLCANPTKTMLPTLRRSLGELTATDRKELGHLCVRTKALLDHYEAENEENQE